MCVQGTSLPDRDRMCSNAHSGQTRSVRSLKETKYLLSVGQTLKEVILQSIAMS